LAGAPPGGFEAACIGDAAGADGAFAASVCGGTTLDGGGALNGRGSDLASSGSGFDDCAAACGNSTRGGLALDDADVTAGRVTGFAISDSDCGGFADAAVAGAGSTFGG